MPEITMCRDKGCSKAKSCYRYTAKPDPLYQSYFVKSPRKRWGCDQFLSMSVVYPADVPFYDIDLTPDGMPYHNDTKERPKPYRVYWTCMECGGEGGDLEDFHTLKEAKQWAKELAEEGKDTQVKKRTKKEMAQ